MVGFSNIAVHEYMKLNVEAIEKIITKGLEDALAFAEILRTR
jgi:uncharacterized protein YutE (UPF0331/DUF86 family)